MRARRGLLGDSSFGAVLLPEHASEGIGALREADERLYVQKRGRRSTRDEPHEVLLQALYEREPDLHTHAHEVTELAVAVGQALGLGGTAIDELVARPCSTTSGRSRSPTRSSIGLARSRTPSGLRAQHTVVGERIVSASPVLRPVGRIVRSSHERWDGTGYPDELAGKEIPLAARIVCACDAFSAMTTPRPYHQAMSIEAALDELVRCSGSQFDPEWSRRSSRSCGPGSTAATGRGPRLRSSSSARQQPVGAPRL